MERRERPRFRALPLIHLIIQFFPGFATDASARAFSKDGL
jgi:hypothetical protein